MGQVPLTSVKIPNHIKLHLVDKAFFIIDWFTDPPTLSFNILKKNKTENLHFLFLPILIFILIMDWNIKNNKKSALIHNAPINFSDICDTTICSCTFTIIKKS